MPEENPASNPDENEKKARLDEIAKKIDELTKLKENLEVEIDEDEEKKEAKALEEVVNSKKAEDNLQGIVNANPEKEEQSEINVEYRKTPDDMKYKIKDVYNELRDLYPTTEWSDSDRQRFTEAYKSFNEIKQTISNNSAKELLEEFQSANTLMNYMINSITGKKKEKEENNNHPKNDYY